MYWNSLILCWWEASTRLQDKWLPSLLTLTSSLSSCPTVTFKGAPHPLEVPLPPTSANQRFKPVANCSKHFQANKSSLLRKTKCQSSLQESQKAGSYHREICGLRSLCLAFLPRPLCFFSPLCHWNLYLLHSFFCSFFPNFYTCESLEDI